MKKVIIGLLAIYSVYFVILDINECANDPCHDDATCTNFAGSFRCVCNNGFSGDGFTCTGEIYIFLDFIRIINLIYG
jgi:hypothetical protein